MKQKANQEIALLKEETREKIKKFQKDAIETAIKDAEILKTKYKIEGEAIASPIFKEAEQKEVTKLRNVINIGWGNLKAELIKECKEIGGCATGEAVITKGYNLPNKYIIHTVGPRYSTGENGEAEKLESAYYESLKLAKKNGLRKIAFPSVSTGIYRFPVNEGAEIALSTAKKFVDENPNSFELILWVLDEKTYVVYKEKYEKIIKE